MAEPAIEERSTPVPSEEQVNVPEETTKTNGQKRAKVVMGPPITDGANTDEDDAAEEDDDDLWNNVVHEFSLVNLRSPKGGSLPATFGGPLGPPIDVPPDVVPCEVVETVQTDAEVPATTDRDDIQEGCNVVAKDW